jgi:hypothetical protein
MDWERARITADVYTLKLKAKLRFLLQFLGIGALLLAAFNMLIAPATAYAAFAPYRTQTLVGGGESGAVFFLADVALMAIGAIVVWLA